MMIEFLLLAVLLIAAVGAGFAWFMNRLEKRLEEKLTSRSANEEKLFAQQIELLGRQVFDESSKKLNDQNLQSLQLLLNPFKERLKEFEKKVEDVYMSEKAERGTLRGELSKLMELNHRMSSEAQSLTRALKGDNRAQGAWGEMLLENILERSGLRKGEEYVLQETHRDAGGNALRPDVIVRLPEGKHIIIDSKVSLISYEEYSNCSDSADQERCARAFAQSLKSHIDSLSSKRYQALESLGSPDFVILFIPLEPAFALAFKLKPELMSEAWEKNIALVSPTTLLTTLRTVASLWRQDRQEKNAIEIAKRGGMLYDKFVALVKDVETMGEQLDRAQKSHQALLNKLHEGNGNLISQVEKLRELGAKAEKKLAPPRLPEA
jgi:DNA recombination protein RmuC